MYASLCNYFKVDGFNPRFESNHTALWRGYIGNCGIVNDRLYLIGLNVLLEDDPKMSLATIFC